MTAGGNYRARMRLSPLALTPDRDIPAPLLTELTALYAANRDFHALSGDFPDPDDIRPEQVAAELADELAQPDAEVLLARSEGHLVGVVVTLGRHPDPADPDPWIGLLMVDAAVHRQGHGRAVADLVEDRFRAEGRTAVRRRQRPRPRLLDGPRLRGDRPPGRPRAGSALRGAAEGVVRRPAAAEGRWAA